MMMGANNPNMLKWNGMDSKTKQEYFVRLSTIYEKLNYPEELQVPLITNAYSIQFASKKKEKINRMDVEGIFPLEKI